MYITVSMTNCSDQHRKRTGNDLTHCQEHGIDCKILKSGRFKITHGQYIVN